MNKRKKRPPLKGFINYNSYMNEKKNLPVGAWIMLILAVVIGATSLTMTLLSHHLEKNIVQQTPEGIYWMPQEMTTTVSLMAAGRINVQAADSTDQLFSDMAFIHNYEFAAYTQDTATALEKGLNVQKGAEAAGFTAVSYAVPDILRNGPAQVLSILNAADTEMIVGGIHASTAAQNQLSIRDASGIKIAYLAFTDGLQQPMPNDEPYLVDVYDDEKTPVLVAKAAGVADLVVVSISWQGEDGQMPSRRQQEIAETLAYAGASVIIGNAGSAIQPTTWIDDCLVYYSLGNLCDTTPGAKRIGALGAVTVTKIQTGNASRIELTNPKVDLIGRLTSDKANRIRLLSGFSEQELPDRETIVSEKTAVIQMLDDSIRIGGIE